MLQGTFLQLLYTQTFRFQIVPDIDECQSSPCYQSATCVNGIGEFTCICPHERDGITCTEGNFYLNMCISLFDVIQCLLAPFHYNHSVGYNQGHKIRPRCIPYSYFTRYMLNCITVSKTLLQANIYGANVAI